MRLARWLGRRLGTALSGGMLPLDYDAIDEYIEAQAKEWSA